MRIRGHAWVLFFLIVAISVFIISLKSMLEREASSSVLSESGNYLIENVSVRGPLVPFDDLAYLRITDKRDSSAVFRSPLYDRSSVDMRSHEDAGVVGIVWIDFYKRDQHFGIRMPEWKTHWLNRFISNTPYEVIGND